MKTTLMLLAGLLLLTLGQAKPAPESEPHPPICFYKESLYLEGDSFKDSCNDCRCGKNGQVACTKMLCAPCLYAGPDGRTMRAYGASFNDGCNNCGCDSGDVTFCSLMFCPHKCHITNEEGHSGWLDLGTTIIQMEEGVPKVCVCKSSGEFIGYSGMQCE